MSLQLLNELGPAGKGALLRPCSVAVYLHVDDGVLASNRREGDQLCDLWANTCAETLEETGFVIKEIVGDADVSRVVGYAPEREPPALALRPEKAVSLEAAPIAILAQVTRPRPRGLAIA